MSRFSLFLFPLVPVALACSSPTTTPSPADTQDAGASADQVAPVVVTDAGNAYPEGPYGNAVDKVLADEEFAGYFRTETTGLASEATYGPLKFSELRNKATVKYALIHYSAYWCGLCKATVTEMVAAYAENASKTLFIDVLVEGATPSDTSTKTQLDSWAKNLKVPYTVLQDPDGVKFEAKTKLGERRTIMLVELQTMKVLYRGTDDFAGAIAKLKKLE